MTPELNLLLSCARLHSDENVESSIRQVLEIGIDWTSFVKKTLQNGLAGLSGRTLERLAPDLVPDDILKAFRINLDRARKANQKRFDELFRLIDELERSGVKVIPFKGPTLAIETYGDLGFRQFQDLDFLVFEKDFDRSLKTLQSLGYQRKGDFTKSQFDLIARTQGQEVLFNDALNSVIEPHTRLIPMKMAIDIDYDGLWQRAQKKSFNGKDILVLAPEDILLLLAIHGGKELWWRINWSCDVAAFLETHPNLDWNAILERATSQGCRRMLLLALALSHSVFDAKIPDDTLSAAKADPMIENLIERIIARWQLKKPIGSPTNKKLSMDRLYLHDRHLQRARYVALTWLVPGPEIISWIALPRALVFLYVPLKVLHDYFMLPLWTIYQAATRGSYKSKGGDS